MTGNPNHDDKGKFAAGSGDRGFAAAKAHKEKLDSHAVKRVHRERERVQSHSSALGYYAPAQSTDDAGAKVQPISNTLGSSLQELDGALARLSEALDVLG